MATYRQMNMISTIFDLVLGFYEMIYFIFHDLHSISYNNYLLLFVYNEIYLLNYI